MFSRTETNSLSEYSAVMAPTSIVLQNKENAEMDNLVHSITLCINKIHRIKENRNDPLNICSFIIDVLLLGLEVQVTKVLDD